MSVYNLGRNYVPVPDAAEPAEATTTPPPGKRFMTSSTAVVADAVPQPVDYVTCDCSTCSYGRAHLAMYPNKPAVPEPSDEVPLADWEIDLLADEPISQAVFGDLIRIGDVAYRVVDADGKPILEPEPAPMSALPRAYWQEEATHEVAAVDPSACKDCIVGEPHACRYLTPNAGWQRVAVIPWGLIEELRTTWSGSTVIDAILDAADEVTS